MILDDLKKGYFHMFFALILKKGDIIKIIINLSSPK